MQVEEGPVAYVPVHFHRVEWFIEAFLSLLRTVFQMAHGGGSLAVP